MRQSLLHILLFCVVAWPVSATAEEPPLRLALDLIDGSQVLGIPSVTSLLVRTSYAEMDVPLSRIARIEMKADGETAVVSFMNGDHLRATPILTAIELETLFGRHSISVEHIRTIAVFSSGSLHRWVFNGVVLKRFTTTGPGTFAEKKGRVYPSSYGTGEAWHGPKAVCRVALHGDFSLTAKVDYQTAGRQLGRILAGVTLSSGESIQLGISDSHVNTVEHIFYFTQGETTLWNSGILATDRSFADYPIEIRRHGNKIDCLVGGVLKKTYTGCDTSAIREVYFAMDQYKTYQPLTEAGIRQLVLQR